MTNPKTRKKTMSESKEDDKQGPDDEFWDLADTFIESANNLCEMSHDAGKVSAALLYAASRFSAFVVASSAEDPADMDIKRDEASDYFVEQFRLMMEENLKDYQENFDDYFEADESE